MHLTNISGAPRAVFYSDSDLTWKTVVSLIKSVTLSMVVNHNKYEDPHTLSGTSSEIAEIPEVV